MKTSREGIELIKSFEGCRLVAYKPVSTEKYYTIGYGHYGSDVKQNSTISQETAEALLVSDLIRFETAVANYEKIYHWTQSEFDALVSFTYNCGVGNLKTLLNSGLRTREQIAKALPLYNKAGGKVLAGLTRRRAAELALFNKQATTNSVVTPTKSAPLFTVGKTYTLQSNMVVRDKPAGNPVGYNKLTANGKKCDKDKNGSLDAGTKITCQAVANVGSDVWVKCPSGWVCGKLGNKIYIK